MEYSGTATLFLACVPDGALGTFIGLPERPVRYFDNSGVWELQDISWYVVTHTGWDDIERVWQAVSVRSESNALDFWNFGPIRDAYLNFMSDIVGRDYLGLAVGTFDYGVLTFEFPITGASEVMADLPCEVDW